MIVKERANDLKDVFRRLKRKDFRGNTGQAVKNSSYQLLTNILAKGGSLFFTILLARIILPERFGLYSLALGTIIIFTAFTGVGIGETLIRFISKSLQEKDSSRAKSYFERLKKLRIILIIVLASALAVSSYWIANHYYQKPLFLALLAGVLYIPLMSMTAFFESLFMATNNFRGVFFKELFFQFSRIVLVIVMVFLLLETSISNEIFVSLIILAISFCYLLVMLYYAFSSRRMPFLSENAPALDLKERKNLNKFLLPLSATVLSGIFFGYIDMIMLGHFVAEEFVGYYGAAFNLAASAGTILGFSAISLLPIFSRLKGRALKRGLTKSRDITFLMALFAAATVFLFSRLIIQWTYGSSYLNSIVLLEIFSLVILILPLTSLHTSFLISQKKTTTLAKILLLTTLLNILLNYLFITQGLQHSMLGALKGAGYATIISKGIYLGLLIFFGKMPK